MLNNDIEFINLKKLTLPKVSILPTSISLEPSEIEMMIKAPNTVNHKGRCHRLIMNFIFNLGLNRSEIINLRLKDIYFNPEARLEINSSIAKKRFVPLEKDMVNEILGYLFFFQPSLEAHDFLIQTVENVRNESPMDGSTIYRIVEKYARTVGIKKPVSPRSSRLSGLSIKLSTKDVASVAQMAGHKNMQTTDKYRRLNQAINTHLGQ